MARKTNLTSVQEMKEINLTPLMDLTFILLITFIITFPLIEQGVAVNLPTGEGDALEESKSVMISVDKAGELYFDQQKMSYEELRESMIAAGGADPDLTVLVRADESIHYGRVVEVIQILREARITKMALVNQSGKDVSGRPTSEEASR
jgi:biopolymer transport protein ExbD